MKCKPVLETNIPNPRVRLMPVKQFRKNGKEIFSVTVKIGTKKTTRQFNTINDANYWLEDFNLFIKGKAHRRTADGLKRGVISRLYIEAIDAQLSRGEIASNTYYRSSRLFRNELSSLSDRHLDEISSLDIEELFKNFTMVQKNKTVVGLKKVNDYSEENDFVMLPFDFDKLYKQTSKEYSRHRKSQEAITKKESYTVLEYDKIKCAYEKLPKFCTLIDNRKGHVKEFSLFKTKPKIFFSSVLLGINLGVRVGEILSLKVSDVDMENKCVYVQDTITRNKQGSPTLKGTTKTNIARKVSMGVYCCKLMSEILELAKKADSEFLIYQLNSKPSSIKKELNIGTRPGPLNPASFRDRIKFVSREVGIPFLPTHKALRKTSATMMVVNGLKNKQEILGVMKTVQLRLGHSSFETTIEKYLKPNLTNEDNITAVF